MATVIGMRAPDFQFRQRKEEFTSSQWDDLEIAIGLLLKKFPGGDTFVPGSNVESTCLVMASKFTLSSLPFHFCSGRFDFTPEHDNA